jgi:glucose/arabinose dehydrogenase
MKQKFFGDYTDEGDYGTGMRIYNGYLYFTTAGEVYRMKLTDGDLVPKSKVELIMKDDYKNDPHGFEHIAKPIAFDNDGHLYVPFGAPGVVCQELGQNPRRSRAATMPRVGGTMEESGNSTRTN